MFTTRFYWISEYSIEHPFKKKNFFTEIIYPDYAMILACLTLLTEASNGWIRKIFFHLDFAAQNCAALQTSRSSFIEAIHCNC